MREHRNVIGTYDNPAAADDVVEALQRQGFSTRHIEVIAGHHGRSDAVVDRLLSWGLPYVDARRYATDVDRGRILVLVETRDDRVNDAVRVLRGERAAPDEHDEHGEVVNRDARPEARP